MVTSVKMQRTPITICKKLNLSNTSYTCHKFDRCQLFFDTSIRLLKQKTEFNSDTTRLTLSTQSR